MANMEECANSGVPMRKAIAMGMGNNPKGMKSGSKGSKGTKKSSKPSKKASMQRLSNAGKGSGY